MVIYERLEVLPSYNALNTFNVCMMVLWRLLSDLSHMGKGQSNCHSGQSLSHCQKYTVCHGGRRRGDVQGGHELWEYR